MSPNSPYGVASLNLTDIRESDQGWYECKVVFLNRSPNSNKNGTWFHLDVHGEYKRAQSASSARGPGSMISQHRGRTTAVTNGRQFARARTVPRD